MARTSTHRRKPSASTGQDNTAGLAAYHAGILQDLGAIEEANTALENKNSALVAGMLIVLPILIDRIHGWTILSAFGVYFMVVSLAYALVASWPRDNNRSTVDVREPKYAYYLGLKDQEMLLKLISTALESGGVTDNENKTKALLYRISVILFVIGVGMCIASFSIHTVSVSWGLPRF